MKLSVMANFLPRHPTTNKLEIVVWISRIHFLIIGIISTSILFAKFVKSAFHPFLNLLHSSLPKLWTSILPFLTPPYLFLAINFIIMVIWKLNSNQFYVVDDDSSFHECNTTKSTYVLVSRVENPQESDTISKAQNTATSEPEENSEGRPWPLPLPETEPEEEEEEFPDSIDATWKAIMDSKSSAIENLLTKSESWGKAIHEHALASLTRAAGDDSQQFKKSEKFREAPTPTKDIVVDSRQFKKSETFRESTATAKDVTAKKDMRKSKTFRDVWVERDEMFRYKVEAFIKMNYDQMRLQRKESDQQQQRLEMVNVSF